MRTEIKKITAADPFIDLAWMKAHAKIQIDAEDTQIIHYIEASRKALEKETNRKLGLQTWQCSYDCWSTWFELPFFDVSEVVSVSYYDTDNQLQTLTGYSFLNPTDGKATVHPSAFPATYSRLDAIKIVFDCGLDCELAKQGVAMQAYQFWSVRGAEVSWTSKQQDSGMLRVINSLRVHI